MMREVKRRFVLLCVLPLLYFISLTSAWAQDGSSKKLIYFGWGSRDTQYVRDHWREMEDIPFDGTGILVAVDRHAWRQGTTAPANQLGWQLMGQRAFQLDQFREAITDLKAAKWQRFTDNFLSVELSNDTSTIGLNWFDDTRWRVVVNNFGVLATIAAEGGMKGLLFDPEHYGYDLFSYGTQRKQLSKPFEDYRQMARQRGREVMTAIVKVMQQPVILSLFAYSETLWQIDRRVPLQSLALGLLPPFYEGILEAMPAGGLLIDGQELAYGFKTRQQFEDAARRVRTEALELFAVPVRDRPKINVGFGLWLDYRKQTQYYTPEEFQQTVMDALDVSDGYVWIYSQGPNFFPPSNIIPAYLHAMAAARAAQK
jgi:hypothetical protein